MENADVTAQTTTAIPAVDVTVASITGERFARRDRSEAFSPGSLTSLPQPVRMAMSLIARKAAGPDEALEPVIELLVPGDEERRSAIAHAFRTNEALREQWLRTYEILRA